MVYEPRDVGYVNHTFASGAEHSLNQGVGRYMNLGMGVCGAVLRAGSWVVQGYKERRKCFI